MIKKDNLIYVCSLNQINCKSAYVQKIAWCLTGNDRLSEPVLPLVIGVYINASAGLNELSFQHRLFETIDYVLCLMALSSADGQKRNSKYSKEPEVR